MKKILSIILIFILAFSLVACSSDKSDETNKPDNTQQETTDNVGIENKENIAEKIEVFIDNTFEYKISFEIPKKFENQYNQKIQSSFADGYYSITIGIKDTDYDLFTIYCTTNKNLKDFENKTGYTLLKSDDKYSYIWFEYEYTLAEGAKKPQLATEFETEYKNIKSSFSVE